MFDKIINKLRPEGSGHEKVGTVIVSEYLRALIVVTRYIGDNNWYFRKYHLDSETSYGHEMRAGSSFSYFKKHGAVCKRREEK